MPTILQTATGEATTAPVGTPPSISINFGSPTSPGSLIVVAFSNSKDYGISDGLVIPGSITDDQSNTYNQDTEIDGSGDGDGAAEIDSLPSDGSTSGINTITITAGLVSHVHLIWTWTFSGNDATATAWEISGMRTSSPLDQIIQHEDSGASASISPGLIILSQSSEFLVTVCSTGTNGNGVTGADSPFDTNFSTVAGPDSWDGYSYVLPASGSYTPNFDLDSNGSGALAVAASYFAPATFTNNNLLMMMGSGT